MMYHLRPGQFSDHIYMCAHTYTHVHIYIHMYNKNTDKEDFA